MSDYSISVVIPNYNNQFFIGECIKSIEEQSYPIEKIIVVDDCSSDDSLEVLNALTKKYDNLQIIPLEKNGGVSHARNTGLAAVTTPYVTFIDADDIYFDCDKIKNEMNLIKHYKETQNKDIVAYSRIVYISRDNTVLSEQKYNLKYYHQGNIFESLLSEKYFFTVMRDYCVPVKYLKEVGGYDETSCFWEDLDLILKLAQKIEFHYTDAIGTGYRQTNSGLSSKPKHEHVIRKNEIFEKHTESFSPIKKSTFKFLKKFHQLESTFIINRLRLVRKIRKLLGGIKK